MENRDRFSIVLPDQKNFEIAYNLAFKLAGEKLNQIDKLSEQCQRSGSLCQITGDSGTIFLLYLNRKYKITIPDVEITSGDSPDKVDLRDKVLILHYLLQARGTPLTQKLITYHELPEGAVYYPTFVKRAVKPLADFFGTNPEEILEASGEFGANRIDIGDVSVTIPAFSRVPVTLVLRKGDNEFPPDANILFDSTISDYLPTEDINVLCQTIVWRLVKSKGKDTNGTHSER